MRAIRRHLTFANVCSFIALTVAMGTGGAYAANTVFSTDIVDGQVKTVDLAASAVNGGKVLDGGLSSSDLAPETLSSGRIFGLDGTDVDADGLTGANIRESSLARVPDAAKLGGVAARPVPQVVDTPVATDRDACESPVVTGTFCSIDADGFQTRWRHWGGGHEAARFYRDAFGVVHLEGLIQELADFGGAATIFVLPVGRRPAARHVFPVVGSEQEGSAAALGRVDVWPDGRVVLEARPDDDPESAVAHYLSLSGISFLAG